MTQAEEFLAQAMANLEEPQPASARERSQIETRKRLMKAWLELAVGSNAHEVSIRDITKKAGVSVGAFYCHFKDKNALNGEVALVSYAKLLRGLETLTDGFVGDIQADHATVLNVLMDFAEAYPDEFRFLWGLVPSVTEEGHEFLALWRDFWDKRIEVFTEQVLAGLPVDPSLNRAVMARAYWGFVEKVLSWWLREKDTVPREVVVDTLSRFVAKGLACDASPEPENS
jgi:AcrR family transcriptional regulator